MRRLVWIVGIVALVWVLSAKATPKRQGEPACDPSYPTLCITVGTPDLDCADVSASNFPVVGRDPHGFDGDNDGVGCESGSRRQHAQKPGTGSGGSVYGTDQGFER